MYLTTIRLQVSDLSNLITYRVHKLPQLGLDLHVPRREDVPLVGGTMRPLDIVGLTPLMKRTGGSRELAVALIDGPVALDHPDLTGQQIREITRTRPGGCGNRGSAACAHGTFVAGMLAARRESVAPAICPNCTFLSRPIFPEVAARNGEQPNATPEELAAAIVDSVQAGARVLNLSVNVTGFSASGERHLAEALSFAASREAIPVAAAPNEGRIVDSALTRHPWVLPVVACDQAGQPLGSSNLSATIGKRGISAPGEGITSLGTSGNPLTISGTSAAAGFVTGAIALLWSELPGTRASDLRFALTNAPVQRRPTVVPRMLNAWAAYQALSGSLHGRKRTNDYG
jgi:subtilisin family serine protease